MRTIKEGDFVTVFWGDESKAEHCEVIHTPSDVGDLWYLRSEDIGDFAINPLSINFDMFKKEPDKKPDEKNMVFYKEPINLVDGNPGSVEKP